MNSDAIQEFLFRHVEKFIFGVLIVVAVFLIYQGVSKPDILAVHQPDAMEQRANQVKLSIDDDHWDAIKEPRIPALDIVARTNKTIQPVDSTVYSLPHPWEAKSIESSIKRSDPMIPVPVELQVHGVVASLAMKSYEPYPLKTLEPADPAVKVEKKEKRLSAREKRMQEMMMMESGYDTSMMDPSMMDPSMMDPSMMMDQGMGGAPAKPVRSIKADLYDQGFRPTGALTEVAPAVGHFIAGTALMPQKKIFDEFEKALAQADGYSPQRDQPYYLGFDLQRADVTNKSVDQLVEADWVTRGNSRYLQKVLLYRWSGMAKEIVAGKYRDPELTAAIPPVLLDHYEWFASHPKIPVGDEPLPGAGSALPEKEQGPVGPITPDDVRALSGKGRTTGGGSMGDMTSYDPGMSTMMMGGYGAAVKVEQPEFKLIRFYDFRDFKGEDKGAPQPGRKYVYRVRIAIEDPNFPANPVAQPRNSTLSAEVFKRVAVLTEKASAGAANPQIAARDASLYTMWSDFSAPSPPVSLPPLYDSYAGPVDPGSIKAYQVGPNNVIEFHSKPPKAKVVVTKWDPAYGAPLPVFSEVMKGSVVSKEKATIEVPDPVALEVKKLPDATINTANVVLDITGGRPLAISPAENQTEPGVLLMFDPSGGLEVVDEIATQRGYRLYSFADERGE
ncbi:MAG: hypothetical protein ACO1RT_02185 [Planctomycetaceae bacterium]